MLESALNEAQDRPITANESCFERLFSSQPAWKPGTTAEFAASCKA